METTRTGMPNENKAEERTPLKIVVNEPANFDACQEVKITSSRDMAKSINNMFSMFDDYTACNLVVQPIVGVGNVVVPILYFRLLKASEYNDPTKTFAFKPVYATKNEEGFMDKLSRISGASAGDIKNSVKITQDGMDVMEDFLVGNRKQGSKINWTDLYQVKQLTDETLIAITGIDLYKIISKIYGEVDSENEPYSYRVLPVGEVGGRAMGSVVNWNLTVFRIRRGALSRSADIIGYGVPVDYGMPPMYKRDDITLGNKKHDPLFWPGTSIV